MTVGATSVHPHSPAEVFVDELLKVTRVALRHRAIDPRPVIDVLLSAAARPQRPAGSSSGLRTLKVIREVVTDAAPVYPCVSTSCPVRVAHVGIPNNPIEPTQSASAG